MPDHDYEIIREMLTLVRRTLHDGEVVEEEAEVLRVWMRHHPDLTVVGPGKEIAEKLVRIFEDRVITVEERRELLDLLDGTAGQDPM